MSQIFPEWNESEYYWMVSQPPPTTKTKQWFFDNELEAIEFAKTLPRTTVEPPVPDDERNFTFPNHKIIPVKDAHFDEKENSSK